MHNFLQHVVVVRFSLQLTFPPDLVRHTGTLTLCVEVVVVGGGVVLVGLKPDLSDQLACFGALMLLVFVV